MAEQKMKSRQDREPSLAAEIFHYLKTQKRWWMTPIVLVLLFLAAIVFLAGLAPSFPFLYTLF